MTHLHEVWMRRALRLARLGFGFTRPNPMVGAVLAKGGQLLAEGYHRKAGTAHAEVVVLSQFGSQGVPKGSTLYVTLEPCSTRGRTPPCTQAILTSGVRRVVVGAVDPNPRHSGRGLDLLRQQGVEVISGVLGEECALLNKGFNKWISTGRPWIVAKAAMTMDGRLSLPRREGRWISGERSRAEVHRVRRRVDAVLVGAGTAVADDPLLTARRNAGEGAPYRRQPQRVILEGRRKVPQGLRMFSDGFAQPWRLSGQPVKAVLRELGRRGIQTALLEGGGRTFGAFADAGEIDEVLFYLAPYISGGPVTATGGHGVGANEDGLKFRIVSWRQSGPDIVCSAMNCGSAASWHRYCS